MTTGARRALSAAVVAVALTSCGSTVQIRSTGTLGQDGLGLPGAPGEVGSTAPLGTTGGSAGGGVAPNRTPVLGGTTGTGTGTAGGSSVGAGVPQPRAAAAPTGVVSKEPVRIGVLYAPGLDAAAQAVGINGLTTGDTSEQAKAVTDWVNAHGGLGGRKVQLFKYDYTSSGNTSATAAQAACEKMTEDFKVKYVISIFNMTTAPTLLPCLAKRGVALLDEQTALGDTTMQQYADYLANPGEFAPGRRTAVMVEDLWSRGWLTKTSRVGVLVVDNAYGRDAYDKFLIPGLRSHGLTVKSTQYVNPDNGNGGASQSSSAALRFAAERVDRVISIIYSPLYFMKTAESQHYRPAYALNSDFGPGALLETAAPEQLNNAAGIGWQPYLDIGKGTFPPPVSPRETLCFDIMKQSGQKATAQLVKGIQLQVCNGLFYLKDIADRIPSLPPDVLTAGRALLRNTYVSSDTFRTDVTHRTDGVAGFRSLAFKQDCRCFQYVSGIKATR